MYLRNSTVSAILAATLLLQGCTAITRDLRHPGGYPGYLLDKRTVDASQSKKLLLLRSTVIIAMAARMANGTIQNADEANSVAHYLSSAADEVNYAAADIYPVDGQAPCAVGAPATTGACHGYYVNFEAGIPLLEGRIVRLLFATLPQDRIKTFAADVQKGNVLGGAWNGLKLVFTGVKGLHYASGAYRSGEEAVAANMLGGACSGHRSEAAMTVWDAVECLGKKHDSLARPTRSAGDMPTEITPETLRAMLTIARTACYRLPLGSSNSQASALASAQAERLAQCNKIAFAPRARPGAEEPSAQPATE